MRLLTRYDLNDAFQFVVDIKYALSKPDSIRKTCGPIPIRWHSANFCRDLPLTYLLRFILAVNSHVSVAFGLVILIFQIRGFT